MVDDSSHWMEHILPFETMIPFSNGISIFTIFSLEYISISHEDFIVTDKNL